MTYKITRTDLASITDLELAFSTERFLPAWDEIPSEFKAGNLYTRIAESIFYGRPMPEFEMAFRGEFEDADAPAAINKCVRAHLQSYARKHEHKIAGVGFLMAQVFDLLPASQPA